MGLQQQVSDDLKSAMKARDRERMGALRMLLSALKNEAITLGRGPQGELSDAEVQRVLATEKKRRDEAASAYAAGGRPEAADKEASEADLIAGYLPAQLSDDELDAVIDEVVAAEGATGMGDMGRVMKATMAQVGTRAEGARVSARVKERLAAG